MKQVKKKPKEPKVKKLKKNADEYVLKKNRSMKFLRIILWILLVFFTVRGILTAIRPDQTQEITDMIHDFKTEFDESKKQKEEALGFAQNFVREYLTYQEKGEKEFLERIRPYVSDDIYRLERIAEFKENAKAIYVKAYRKEDYTVNQMDVYVIAEVQYEKQVLLEDKVTFEKQIVTKQTTLKVPVFAQDGSYVVENLPMFVADDIQLKNFTVKEYYGTEVAAGEKVLIEDSLANFLTAYYSQDQGVINYYLSREAEKSKFMGLSGRYHFVSMESLSCYQEEGQNEVVCIVQFMVADEINETVLLQRMNIKMQKETDKYYVMDMTDRIGNLKSEGEQG